MVTLLELLGIELASIVGALAIKSGSALTLPIRIGKKGYLVEDAYTFQAISQDIKEKNDQKKSKYLFYIPGVNLIHALYGSIKDEERYMKLLNYYNVLVPMTEEEKAHFEKINWKEKALYTINGIFKREAYNYPHNIDNQDEEIEEPARLGVKITFDPSPSNTKTLVKRLKPPRVNVYLTKDKDY